jgi:plasmid stabilization system protein ParE
MRDELLAGIRSVSVKPYVIFYRVQPDAVEIFRVLHDRRDVAAILTSSPAKNVRRS